MRFEIEKRSYGDPDVQKLVAAVQQEYVRRYGGPDGAAVEPGEFDPPDGLFLLGLRDGLPVATGGWRRIGEGIAEIKRMYVADAARRLGLARAVLAELERTAAAAGFREVVLNTGPEQPEAVALYEQAGYLQSEPFGHYACHPRALFYRKPLAGDLGGGTETGH